MLGRPRVWKVDKGRRREMYHGTSGERKEEGEGPKREALIDNEIN